LAVNTATAILAMAATRQLHGGTPRSRLRPGALLSSDDLGSSVERTAKLHPLWHLPCGSFQYERGCAAKRPQLGTW
jgi:hypothetical protein